MKRKKDNRITRSPGKKKRMRSAEKKKKKATTRTSIFWRDQAHPHKKITQWKDGQPDI
jgi:hypothetical protein